MNLISAEGSDKLPAYRLKPVDDLEDVAIRVPLPRRSLLVLTGQLRYQWEHAILRKDIHTRRIVIAYRELVQLERISISEPGHALVIFGINSCALEFFNIPGNEDSLSVPLVS